MQGRILIYAPVGKDARLVSELLERAGLAAAICLHAQDTLSEMGKGVGALLMVEEALSTDFLNSITTFLKHQETWSDLPILLMSKRSLASPEMDNIYRKLGNVTLLERPVQRVTLISAAKAALRTRMRQYEMREVDQRKDEFLAMLAHELRNPLAPISAASELLKIGSLSPELLKKTSDIISRQVNHMTGLIDDLLDMSRVSRGLVEIDETVLNVEQIVTNAVEQVRPLIDARCHRFIMHMPLKLTLVRGDQERLIQVLSNLLGNSAKYTPKGGNITLTVEVVREDVVFRVRDDGIGIAPNMIDHVFELFSQAKRTPDRSQGGLGIGLSLVKSLIELHHGTVAAHSPGIGFGSTFSVTLPRVDARDESVAKTIPEMELPATKRRRLLIVDDNADAARMLGMFLEAAGHEIIIEYSAHSALERARIEKPDVCLLDIGLPDMDGNELARSLRAQPETTGSILIAITGYGQERDKKSAGEAGFSYHFVKPVDMGRLLKAVAE